MHAMSLRFEGVEFEKIFDENGVEWMKLEDAGRCVGYATPRQSAARVINRNPKDFEGLTTEVILASVNGSRRKHTLLNREALLTLALLAKTEKAVRFRAFIREFFMSPNGGYQQMLKVIEEQQKAITQLQAIASKAIGAIGTIASANARALALVRWHRPEDPKQMKFPFREVREISEDPAA